MTGARSALALALLASLACRSGGAGADLAAPDAASAPAARVVIDSPSGRSRSVQVEVARTAEEQARGLMFRERLGPDEGMLFVFPQTAVHAFWMRNTLIPLDMLFIDEGGTVVGIVERAEPLTDDPRSVGRASRYVLEVNGGWSASNGVATGDRARFEGVSGAR